jgi:hypothetical protein
VTITMPFRIGNGLSEQGNVPGNLHVPMVYEQLPVDPVRWEYHVMIVDTREMDVPDSTQLNELGVQGWLLVGILDQRSLGSGMRGGDGQMTSDYVSRVLDSERQRRGSLVYFYFVRQRSEKAR